MFVLLEYVSSSIGVVFAGWIKDLMAIVVVTRQKRIQGAMLKMKEKDEVLTVRPPPEPPSRRGFLLKKTIFALYFIAVLHFNFHVVVIVVFLFYFIYCCKTYALGLGDERSVVTVAGLIMPKLGSTSYIALSKVIRFESGPMTDGYMLFFCYFKIQTLSDCYFIKKGI
ncbi:unnamed protein product [Cuscuta epithymum]|uniref:Uncharacterized protein n=1 Tax=Cuscuta epithymum TaxID=186058 RepID=A0AAV0EDU1_9ASTE|nr:unnamed protein product [Cuscuta epithymum]CAH9119351.1 unnamed protein product [Cuscuta epithymum]